MSQYFHHNPVRVKSSSLFGTASVALHAKLSQYKRRDKQCQAFFRKVTKSTLFQILMITTVTANSFLLVLGTNYDIHFRMFRVFETLIIAVGETVYTVASVLTLLFLLMFVFAILGFCLFGNADRGDLTNWGNLAAAFFTLFSLATVDGWTNLQEELDKRKFTVSRAFTILFILLASFIFLNMFVGVMIMHTEDSIKKFEREMTLERNLALMEEKQMILRRQQDEVNRLMNTQKVGGKSFVEMVEGFKRTLRHTDPMVLDEFCTSLSFIDIYLDTLDNQDVIVSKLQELYYEIANVLNLMLEDMPPREKSSSTLES
ncbi:cation channel sperm-associated protein 3 isoform X2 [Rattus norvegicus]|uniref:cation channel sperm-associated protein 3 isoform X2 n=1 Tax=Rattus norvegicus TaxID=10116 RepID=UPI001916E280|nr:cation channel sperm-associated protein 3 isoform X2 [Rattus norvegicus]